MDDKGNERRLYSNNATSQKNYYLAKGISKESALSNIPVAVPIRFEYFESKNAKSVVIPLILT